MPFVLADFPVEPPAAHADPRIEVILRKLDTLMESAATSNLEIQTLRELNLQVLAALKGPSEPHLESRIDAPVTKPAARLTLRLLGPFEAHAGASPLTGWPGKKSRLLLAYLALERGRLVPRDVLIELFWPDARAERGSNNLSIAVHQLRTTLVHADDALASAVIVRQGLYGLDAWLVHADLWDFQAHLAAARHALERRDANGVRKQLGAAIELCHGDLLESDPYDEWILEPRRSIATARLQALTWLAAEASRRSDWSELIDLAGRILERDHGDEAAYRWLMLGHWKSGNRAQALQQYSLCRDWLHRELGLEPSEETRQTYAMIRAS